MNFLEENSNLIGDREGDTLFTRDAILGYRLDDQWRVAAVGSLQKFDKTENENQVVYFAAGYTWNEWQVMSGVGQYVSTHQERAFSAFATLTWTGLKSLSLF